VAERSKQRAYDGPTVAIWIALGALLTVTSILSLMAGGIEALYLVVTGWIVGPFFLLWAYRKLKRMVER
jgi:hypothetical protein